MGIRYLKTGAGERGQPVNPLNHLWIRHCSSCNYTTVRSIIHRKTKLYRVLVFLCAIGLTTVNSEIFARVYFCETLKTQKMKIIIFSLLLQIQTDDNDTLLLSIPNTSVFKDTDHHQLCIADLLCFARGVPTNQ